MDSTIDIQSILEHKYIYNPRLTFKNMIDVQEKKNKIISFLKVSGPSLPVRIAKVIEMDPVFASAISSELLNSKQIKTSHMKIGSSPLYLLPGQEQKLEDHTENLKSIEKDAYLKLKENKIIMDEDEEPAIRVALRNIKDFAIPFRLQEKIVWKYAFTPEEEIQKLLNPTKEEKPQEKKEPEKEDETEEEVPKAWEVKKEEIKQAKEESKKIENIFKQTKTSTKQTFLKQVEDFLENKNRRILSIEEVDKKKVIAKIESENKTALLFAFNKKKITEDELIKCYKRAKISNLSYHIITTGDLTKKMNETIDAYKKLIKIEKLDNR